MINKKEYRFIISGGGSGGHIYPALSIADGLKNKFINSELLFVGSKNKMEMKIIPERGYRIKGLNISGFKRKFSFSNVLYKSAISLESCINNSENTLLEMVGKHNFKI